VDELRTNFVSDAKGCLMSPSTVSWRRDGKVPKLDHVITWNLPSESSVGVLGSCWRNVGTEIPDGCTELEHPELARRLTRTVAFGKHVWESF
jgi:hypothetical protein